MRTVAVYNVKGGVGKTTTAVNLSYLSAAAGRRTLLWDLDPQAAASFAFRVQPDVSGFARKSLENGRAPSAAIKETDYENLHLLPADFAYRKFERFLDSLRKPERLVTALLETLGRDYDTVFLDCRAGSSRLIEGVFAAADAILVPAIPTVLSLRMVARLIEWAERFDAHGKLTAFFSMVDRRKSLHRHAIEWAAAYPDLFLSTHVPYSNVVEQMAVRRMPLPAFAPRESATRAFVDIYDEVQKRLEHVTTADVNTSRGVSEAIESLIAQIDLAHSQPPLAARQPASSPASAEPAPPDTAVHFVHRFDTERRDLEQRGHLLELHERNGRLSIVVAVSRRERVPDATSRTEVHIDRAWATQILTGELSPLAALERRLGATGPRHVEHLKATVGARRLRRIDTSVGPGERVALVDLTAAQAS